MSEWWQFEVVVLAMFVRKYVSSCVSHIFRQYNTGNIFIILLLYWNWKYKEYVEYCIEKVWKVIEAMLKSYDVILLADNMDGIFNTS